MIEIERVDHIGIRVMDVDRALAFYAHLGFGAPQTVPDDDVTIISNGNGVEINLITNGNDANQGRNILMDMDSQKYAGYTHVALRVASIEATIRMLQAADIPLSGGPVKLGDGNMSVFVRDPDRNVIELRERR